MLGTGEIYLDSLMKVWLAKSTPTAFDPLQEWKSILLCSCCPPAPLTVVVDATAVKLSDMSF